MPVTPTGQAASFPNSTLLIRKGDWEVNRHRTDLLSNTPKAWSFGKRFGR
jgi:hypothetical protein